MLPALVAALSWLSICVMIMSSDRICWRKQFRNLIIRQSRSLINGTTRAGVNDNAHSTTGTAALTILGIAEGILNGEVIDLITSTAVWINFRTLIRQSMEARNGASCNRRLKVIAQSVGIPLEMSENELSVPPPGSFIVMGAGEGRLIVEQSGRSNNSCRSEET